MPLFVNFGDFSLRMRSFDHTETSRLKYNVLFKFSTAIFLYKHDNFRRATPFSEASVTMSANAQ